MSRFYANIEGNRGPATRQGTAKSGMYGHVRGWGVGASVQCWAEGDVDVIEIRGTGGSRGYDPTFHIATLRRENGQITVEINRDAEGRIS